MIVIAEYLHAFVLQVSMATVFAYAWLTILGTPISMYVSCHYQHHSLELQTKIAIISCVCNYIPMGHESCL